MRSVSLLGLLGLAAASVVSTSPAAEAAPAKPVVAWHARTLPANGTVALGDLARIPAGHATRWKAGGSCTIQSSVVRIGQSGRCSLTVTVAGAGAAKPTTSTSSFAIVPVTTITPAPTTTSSTVFVDRVVGASDAGLVTPDGRTRTYRLYVPSSLTPDTRAPLVVVLHGRGGWGANFEAISGFDGIAERDRFIAVYPDGYSPPGPRNQSWNGGYCCAAAQTQNIDDVGYVRALVQALVVHDGVDSHRVYVAGYSNGAILAYRLGCQLSDVITAIGLQSGSLGVTPCKPVRPVPLLHIHGTADLQSPINGGVSPVIVDGIDQRSALSSVQEYASAIGATSGPSTVTRPWNAEISVSTWTGASPAAVVQYEVITGATHAWMGHPQAPSQDAIIGKPYTKLDSTAEIWSFVSRFTR